jgi:hypothetical protein
MILKYIFMAFDAEIRECGPPVSAAWKEDFHRSLPNAQHNDGSPLYQKRRVETNYFCEWIKEV